MIVYVHNNPDKNSCFKRGTIAFDLPTKDHLNSLFSTHSTGILMSIGVANVHPKEQFVKSIGRAESVNKMSLVKCDFESVQIRGTSHVYHFLTSVPYSITKGKQTIRFGLSTNSESKNVHLLYAYFDEDKSGMTVL